MKSINSHVLHDNFLVSDEPTYAMVVAEDYNEAENFPPPSDVTAISAL